jgi:hypothetical protein
MSASQVERQRSLLIGIAAVALALAVVSSRMVKSAQALAVTPAPTPSFDAVSSYLGPLPADTSVLAHVGSAAMVVVRDPFALPSVQVPVETTARVTRPKPGERQHWVVSSILFEGSKRSAIVNNAWVTVGDTLGGGYRVTAVERDHIVVTGANGVRHIVPIQGGEA